LRRYLQSQAKSIAKDSDDTLPTETEDRP
jgi:hypothetical protein